MPTVSDASLLEEIEAAGNAGALLPLARLWTTGDLARQASDAIYSAIMAEVLLRRRERRAWPKEESAVVAVIGSVREGDRWLFDKVAEACSMPSPVSWHADEPGRVALLVAPTKPLAGMYYGTASCLTVTATPWAGRDVRRFERGLPVSKTEDLRAELANSVANDAVDDLLRRHGVSSWTGTMTLGRWGRVTRLPGVRLPVEGNSLALAVAVATVSAIAGVPIPPGWGFTGALDPDGRVLPVSGIMRKLEGARDKGLVDVAMPRTADAAPGAPEGLRLHEVESLEEALSACCHGLVERAVDVISRASRRSPAERKSLEEAAQKGADVRRVLISIVAKNDPFGRQSITSASAVSDATMIASEEGPLLAIASVLQPHGIWYLYTTGPDAENDLTHAAESVDVYLRHRHPAADPVPIPLDSGELPDPTNFPALMRSIAGAIRTATRAAAARWPGERVQYYVNASSGTPQMQAVIHLLSERGIPKPAELVQVREAKWLHEGESRLRIIELPALDS